METCSGRSAGKGNFFCIVTILSNCNTLKTLIFLVHTGLFWCLHNLPNSGKYHELEDDKRIFYMCTWSFCIRHVYIYIDTWGTSVYSLIWRTLFCRVCKKNWLWRNLRAHSLTCNGHPSTWWPCLIIPNFLFLRTSTLALLTLLNCVNCECDSCEG